MRCVCVCVCVCACVKISVVANHSSYASSVLDQPLKMEAVNYILFQPVLHN